MMNRKDSKSVNVISQGVFSKDSKLMVLAVQFFLSPRQDNDPDDEDKKYRRTRREIIKEYGHGAVKKTNKRKKKLREAVRALAKERKNELDKRVDDRRSYNYAAMVMINDPQGYAEKVYQVLKRCNDKFETRIMLMNFIARLISCHQLLVLDFYSFMQKYMQPSQQCASAIFHSPPPSSLFGSALLTFNRFHPTDITQILAVVAQACHPLVTPDAIEPLIMAICNQFVSDRRPPEALAIGYVK
jgi:protein SDA1